MDLGYFTATYAAKDLPETPLDTAVVTREEDGFCLAMNSATSFGLPRIWSHDLPWFRPSACGEAVRLEEMFERLMNKEAVPNKAFAVASRWGTSNPRQRRSFFSGRRC